MEKEPSGDLLALRVRIKPDRSAAVGCCGKRPEKQDVCRDLRLGGL